MMLTRNASAPCFETRRHIVTRRHLQLVLVLVMATYAIAIIFAVWLRAPFAVEETSRYRTYKDILPLVIAIPAAYLAFAFQRRNSYLQALRALWSQIVGAITEALTYTEMSSPSQAEHLVVLSSLRAAIEEVRGVFKNVPARSDLSADINESLIVELYSK